jgi:hypothetical protein
MGAGGGDGDGDDVQSRCTTLSYVSIGDPAAFHIVGLHPRDAGQQDAINCMHRQDKAVESSSHALYPPPALHFHYCHRQSFALHQLERLQH